MSGRTQGDRKLSRPAANATATLAAERHGRYDGRPASVRPALRRGRDVHGAYDFAREEPLLAPLVPGLVGLERHAEHRGEHRGRQILCVLARDRFALAVAVMLRDVAVMRRV